MANLDSQLEELITERNAFEAENIALKARNSSLEHINQGLVDAINQSDDDGKHPDIVWLMRDELQDYSDVHQAGGINAVKASAVQEFANRYCGDCTTEYQTKLNEDANEWAYSVEVTGKG